MQVITFPQNLSAHTCDLTFHSLSHVRALIGLLCISFPFPPLFPKYLSCLLTLCVLFVSLLPPQLFLRIRQTFTVEKKTCYDSPRFWTLVVPFSVQVKSSPWPIFSPSYCADHFWFQDSLFLFYTLKLNFASIPFFLVPLRHRLRQTFIFVCSGGFLSWKQPFPYDFSFLQFPISLCFGLVSFSSVHGLFDPVEINFPGVSGHPPAFTSIVAGASPYRVERFS